MIESERCSSGAYDTPTMSLQCCSTFFYASEVVFLEKNYWETQFQAEERFQVREAREEKFTSNRNIYSIDCWLPHAMLHFMQVRIDSPGGFYLPRREDSDSRSNTSTITVRQDLCGVVQHVEQSRDSDSGASTKTSSSMNPIHFRQESSRIDPEEPRHHDDVTQERIEVGLCEDDVWRTVRQTAQSCKFRIQTPRRLPLPMSWCGQHRTEKQWIVGKTSLKQEAEAG